MEEVARLTNLPPYPQRKEPSVLIKLEVGWLQMPTAR